jgi:hypothetical protein
MLGCLNPEKRPGPAFGKTSPERRSTERTLSGGEDGLLACPGSQLTYCSSYADVVFSSVAEMAATSALDLRGGRTADCLLSLLSFDNTQSRANTPRPRGSHRFCWSLETPMEDGVKEEASSVNEVPGGVRLASHDRCASPAPLSH